MRTVILFLALSGCFGRSCSCRQDDGDDDVPVVDDDTGTHPPSTIGWLDAKAIVQDSEEPCQANVFDQSGELVTTDYTGDDDLPSLKAGTYTVSFGVTAAALFPEEDEGYVDAVDDAVDGLYLHQDTEGNLWAGPEQKVVVTAGDTTPVAGELSLVPAMCPDDEDGCNGPDDEVGQWTCEEDGETYQDFISIQQEGDDLTIEIPCIGTMDLDGDQIFRDGVYEGGFITAGWIEILDVDGDDDDDSVTLWVGLDGDKP